MRMESSISVQNTFITDMVFVYTGEKLVGKEVPVFDGLKTIGYKIFNEEGIIETEFDYIYSGEELTEEKTLNSDGVVISSVQYKYINGQLVSQTEKDNNGVIKSISKFKRNSSNDIIEYLVIIPKDNTEFKFSYEYDYDSEGNWTKQTRFYDEQIEIIVIRNIEYFSV
jgi:hypothetical protein